MPEWRWIYIAFCLIVPTAVYAQQRPLRTDDAGILKTGRIRADFGIEFLQRQRYSLSGLQGNLTRLGVSGIHVGVGDARIPGFPIKPFSGSHKIMEKQIREKRLVAATSVGAAVILTATKLVVGLLTGSLGILAEAAHSALDMAAAMITLFAVRVSDRPADASHLYGHGKVENFSALSETLLLLITCVWIIYKAIHRLFFRTVAVDPSLWAFLVMGLSIAVDFSRSRALARVAKKYKSQALEADAPCRYRRAYRTSQRRIRSGNAAGSSQSGFLYSKREGDRRRTEGDRRKPSNRTARNQRQRLPFPSSARSGRYSYCGGSSPGGRNGEPPSSPVPRTGPRGHPYRTFVGNL
jgi:hypothetical protein